VVVVMVLCMNQIPFPTCLALDRLAWFTVLTFLGCHFMKLMKIEVIYYKEMIYIHSVSHHFTKVCH